MTAQDKVSIVHRKTRVGRDDYDARAMSPAKALRLSLTKAADRLSEMVLTVTTVEQLSLTQPAIEEAFAGGGLLVLLDGRNGLRGALQFDTQFLAALIEIQTTGAVKPGEAAARPATRTDAALAASLVDAFMAGYDEEMQSAGTGHEVRGFAFGDMIEDARTLALTLTRAEFDLFRLGVDIAAGAKTGQVNVLFAHQAPAGQAPAPGEPGGAGEGMPHGLDQNALAAQATFDAVLARLSLPLKTVCGFEAGMQLPLNVDNLGAVELYAPKNHLIAKVQLGQLNGMRAVRFLSGDGASATGGAEPPPPQKESVQDTAPPLPEAAPGLPAAGPELREDA